MEAPVSPDARILIVDDSPANITLLDLILRYGGYHEITSTTDPRQVLSLVASVEPDLILLDLLMPGMDGFTVLERLRRLPAPASLVPVIVLTADGTSHSRVRALSCGASDFLIKPFSSAELLLRVRAALETGARASTQSD